MRHGNYLKRWPERTLQERFECKVLKTESCWLWQAAISSEGYGRLSIEDRPAYAHRISYQLFKGEIPEGMDLDHLCRNRACVNPDHLEAVTRSENLKRGDTGNYLKAIQAAKTHCPKGHPYFGENLRIRPDGARTCKECARQCWRKWNEARK